MKIYGTETDAYILKELGNRIRDIRIGRNMTQKDLSEHSGVSFSTVTRIENGTSVNFSAFLKILSSLQLLQNIDFLVPEQTITPQDIIKGTKKKKRASKIKAKSEWKWGDDKK